jgi:DNA primase
VNPRKDAFYCHGCGQDGDLFRFFQLSRGLSFRQSLASLDPEIAPKVNSSAVLEKAAAFYQQPTESQPPRNALSQVARRTLSDWNASYLVDMTSRATNR